jgi:NAD(P)-dependent dehydrogenase (short-subunit alcohol dehydrogenase family)
MSPSERIVLVTGANKGLGREVARQLASRGSFVYLGSRDLARGRESADDLRRIGLAVSEIALDVTDDGSVARAAERIAAERGRLDVLVNNAGIHIGAPALEIDVADMRATYETNVFGLVRVTRAMLPLLRVSASPRIVNVASTTASHARTSDPTSMFAREDRSLAYASSKAAVTMLTVQYAGAFRRRPDDAHILVNAVTPGYVSTDLNGNTGHRTVEEGSRVVVAMATLDDGGPSGGFFEEAGPVPW